MKRFFPSLLVLAVAGCRWDAAPDKYGPEPVEEDSRWSTGHKTIWDDKNNILGFVEHQDNTLRTAIYEGEEHLKPVGGEVNRDYFVKDRNYNLIGFITERGKTYRFRPNSAEYDYVGNYTIQDGIRTLLSIKTRFELRPTRLED